MPGAISGFINRFIEFFNTLSPLRKISLAGLALTVVVVISGMFIWASKTNYQVLVTNLAAEDSTAIIRYLRDKKIPFTVDEMGKTISVPPEKVYDLRLELASQGLAQTGVVGYEVFDHQSFGVTSTVQKINQQRALEGELIRTINHIRGVQRSRVHLALPTHSAFLEEQEKTTASVIIDMSPGLNLSEDQIKGIQNMVAAAVEGLDSNEVTIVSSTGKQLSKNSKDPAALFAAATMDYQRKYEKNLEEKIKDILEKVVGEGKVVAMVNADFDFSQVSETQTLLDSDGVTPRSVHKDVDTMSGVRPLPEGKPGVQSQVPGANGAQQTQTTTPTVSNNTNRTNEVTNYEIPKTTRYMQKPMASLKRMSVAVTVDGEYISAKVGDVPKFTAWPPEKLAEFRSLVANVTGWDEKRDPPIEIKNLPFYQENVEQATLMAEQAERRKMVSKLVQWGGIGLVFTLFFLFVVRPFIRWVTENTVDSVEDFLPQTIEELEKSQANKLEGMEEILPEMEEKVDPEKIQGEMLREKIVSLINENPHKAAQVIHEWINVKVEAAPDAKTKKQA